MAKYDLEKLLEEAYSEKAIIRSFTADDSKCLDNETLAELYYGTLSQAARQSAVKHLADCYPCCIDVASYFELSQIHKTGRELRVPTGKSRASTNEHCPTNQSANVRESLNVPSNVMILTKHEPEKPFSNPITAAPCEKPNYSAGRSLTDLYEIGEELHRMSIRALLKALGRCPATGSAVYIPLMINVMERSLGPVVAWYDPRANSAKQYSCGVIELPIRTDSLEDFPLWQTWAERYGIECIALEAKNETTRATPDDVKHLKSYLDRAQRGRLGILVSRSGFTRDAMKRIQTYVQADQALILPLRHADLKRLLKLRALGPSEVMHFLHQKEASLIGA